MDLPSIEYELELTRKHLSEDDRDFLKVFLLWKNAEVFVLDTQAIKSEACIAPELIYHRRKVVRADWIGSGDYDHKEKRYPNEYLCIKLDDSSSHTIYTRRYGWEQNVVFYDDDTFGVYAKGNDNRVFISKSKDSIKKLVDDIFATAKFEHKSIKEITYKALIKWIDL